MLYPTDLYARKLCCHPEHSNLIAICLSNGKVNTLELDANNSIKTTAISKDGHEITSSKKKKLLLPLKKYIQYFLDLNCLKILHSEKVDTYRFTLK